jgi:hypothetical protein
MNKLCIILNILCKFHVQIIRKMYILCTKFEICIFYYNIPYERQTFEMQLNNLSVRSPKLIENPQSLYSGDFQVLNYYEILSKACNFSLLSWGKFFKSKSYGL